MKILIALVLLLLPGCGGLPSWQYCDEVTYQRKGLEIDVKAKCRAPIGQALH